MSTEQLHEHIRPFDWIGYLTIKLSIFFSFTDLKIRDIQIRPKGSFGSKSGSNLGSGSFFDHFESEVVRHFLSFKLRF